MAERPQQHPRMFKAALNLYLELRLRLPENNSSKDIRFGLRLSAVVIDDLLEANLLEPGHFTDTING